MRRSFRKVLISVTCICVLATLVLSCGSTFVANAVEPSNVAQFTASSVQPRYASVSRTTPSAYFATNSIDVSITIRGNGMVSISNGTMILYYDNGSGRVEVDSWTDLSGSGLTVRFNKTANEQPVAGTYTVYYEFTATLNGNREFINGEKSFSYPAA